MKLEVKHIAPYLPYGLKVLRPDNKTILELHGIIGTLYIFNTEGKTESYGAIKSNGNKPILRPLKEIVDVIEMFDDMDYWMSNYEGGKKIEGLSFGGIKKIGLDDYQKLFSMHFDVFGLIPQGLAVDINTLK